MASLFLTYIKEPDYHYLTATVKLSPILQDIEV